MSANFQQNAIDMTIVGDAMTSDNTGEDGNDDLG